MKVEMWAVAKVKLYDRNPRVNDAAVDAVAKSIEEFGFRQPLVVDTKGVIVVGHTRYAAALLLGMTKVPVHVTKMSPAKCRAYRIADNKTNEAATWNEDMLATELRDLDDFAWTDLGFNQKELDDLLGDDSTGKTDPDDVPEVSGDPITQPGDLWVMGDHRLLCGDATKAEDVGQLLDGASASAVVTDPPYGIGFKYVNYDDSQDNWFELINSALPIMRQHVPFVVMPCCRIDRMKWWYENHAPDWIIAWYKGSPGQRSHVGFSDWEPHLVWGKPHKQMHDYFQTKCGFDKLLKHSCPKPVAWALWLCERAVPSQGIILDPFLGSGTTIIAAEQLGRRCFGMEIEPRYCDVAVKRWENFTGNKAERNSK